MIIARSMGSLGNQIFQVAACVSHLRSREKFVGFGFEQFSDAFSAPDGYTIRFISLLSRRVTKMTFSFLESCAQARLVGEISYSATTDARRVIRKRGVLPFAVLNAPYPNHEKYFNSDAVQRFVFGKDLANVRGYSAPAASDVPRCFVHVRRGDFLFWPSEEKPAAVPESWFVQEMRAMQTRLGQCEFILVSDDLENCGQLSDFPGKVTVFRGNYAEAFREMLSCDAGILSPSSFSWWAAWALSQKKSGFFVAPNFWNNWMEGKWKLGISRSSFLAYASIGDEHQVESLRSR